MIIGSRIGVLRAAAMALGAFVCSLLPATGQINMPDPSLINGRAIPAPELAAGTVTVRVVREAIGNNISGQEVRVTVAETARTATTDAEGRAEFSDLPLGQQASAEATVDGESLVSEPFAVPSSGGLRVILVAGLSEAAARREQEQAAEAEAPPVKGTVVFGGESRIVMEFRDDRLEVFYILSIVNTARNRVDIGGPLILDLPTGAAGATTMEGSAESASVRGDRLTVTGPFAPGTTLVQVGFELPYDDAEETIEQRLPVALEQVTVAIERVGALALSSPQFSQVQEVQANDGTPYQMANGPSLAAGDTLVIQLSGLPVHSKTPRYVALSMALLILALGGWMAFGRAKGGPDASKRLRDRRDSLLGELAQLERRSRSGGLEPKHAARRQRIIADLERIYGELDEVGAGPHEGGQGVPA